MTTNTTLKAPTSDWVLDTIHDRGPHEFYRYRITGINLNYPSDHSSRRFSWSVPSLDDPRYDTTNATRTSR